MKDKYESNWFIIQIKRNYYEKAKSNLEYQGFETFLPILESTKRNANSFHNKSSYLFPGYMFVAFDPLITRWNKINSTYGVSRILTFNGRPAEISSNFILFLKKQCDKNDQFLTIQTLQKGDKIKILTGPFSNFIAKIDDINPDKRVYALLEFMGQTKRLNLSHNNNVNYKKI